MAFCDFMTRKTRSNVQWTFDGHALVHFVHQCPEASSAIAQIASVLELQELL